MKSAFAGCVSLKCGSVSYHPLIYEALVTARMPVEALHPCATESFTAPRGGLVSFIPSVFDLTYSEEVTLLSQKPFDGSTYKPILRMLFDLHRPEIVLL